MNTNAVSFPHRKTNNGLYESICPTCFATVARAKAKADLAQSDTAHICDSALLAERGLFSSSVGYSPVGSSPVRATAKASDLNHLQQ